MIQFSMNETPKTADITTITFLWLPVNFHLANSIQRNILLFMWINLFDAIQWVPVRTEMYYLGGQISLRVSRLCSVVLVWACHRQIVNPIQRLSVLNGAELWWQKRFAILCQSAGSAGSCNQTPDFTGMWLLLGSSQITLWWKSTETKCAGAKCCRFSLNHRPHLSWTEDVVTEPGSHSDKDTWHQNSFAPVGKGRGSCPL